MIPEGREVFPRMTVEENMLLGAYTIKDKSTVKDTKEKVYPDLSSSQKERKSTSPDTKRRRTANACHLQEPNVKPPAS